MTLMNAISPIKVGRIKSMGGTDVQLLQIKMDISFASNVVYQHSFNIIM